MFSKVRSFLLGIVSPKLIPPAAAGETVGESLRLVWAVYVWRPRVLLVGKIAIPVLGLAGTLYTLAI